MFKLGEGQEITDETGKSTRLSDEFKFVICVLSKVCRYHDDLDKILQQQLKGLFSDVLRKDAWQ